MFKQTGKYILHFTRISRDVNIYFMESNRFNDNYFNRENLQKIVLLCRIMRVCIIYNMCLFI